VLQPIRETFLAGDYPDLLVGLEAADDAAVYRINERQAIVATTDFFPPIVDDPYDFGAIAAANAMSDIYAMGGQVLFGINLVAFPADLDREILREILRGGAEKMREAGAVVVGGHSIDDREPKYGLAVVGIIDPLLVRRKGGAQVGDLLILTKPLGAGIITTALKEEKADAVDVAAAVASMKSLNRQAASAALTASANGMTDITGYGLLGHAREMAIQAGVNFHFDLAGLRWLPGAERYAEMRTFPGGMGRNMDYFAPFVRFGAGVSLQFQDMLWTPETSGGLLISLPPARAEELLALVPEGRLVGRVMQGSGLIYVE
jgi:selenide,water dikinase